MNHQSEFEIGVISPVECYKEAWELVKPHFWLLFAITIVGVMIGGATLYILTGAMICGIMICYLDVIEGRTPVFEHLFRGFKHWSAGLFVFAVMFVPTFIVITMTYFPILAAAFMGQTLSQEELWAFLAGIFAVELVVMVIMVCLHTLLLFSFPLIVDKNISGWAAMKLSVRSVWANLQGIAGLWTLGFVVSLIGLLLFCIGVYFTIPIIIGAHMVAYRKIFPGTLSAAPSS